MSKRQSTGLRGCVIIFLAISCLVAVAGGWAASELPRWATRNFGLINSRHGWGMRVYLSTQLYMHRYDLQQPLDAFGTEGILRLHWESHPFR